MLNNMIEVPVVNEECLNTVPTYATEHASGVDLKAAEDIIIQPSEVKMIRTGLYVAVPEGWEIQIRSRSGLALKKQIIVLNQPGTVDADYRGPMNVILFNGGKYDFEIKVGDRIAQAVLCPVGKIIWNLVSTLDETKRNTGGFGSTGV